MRSLAACARRATVLLALLTAVIVGLGLFATAHASADVNELCGGYAACSTGAFTTHGYEQFEDESWWAMYAGDNCTNYAAYVESRVFGVPEPDYLLGDADQWAANAAAHGVEVDSTPSVGAVATWGTDVPAMGGYGHVAVVEDVGPDDSYIDVSQSGMGTAEDGYDWERIYAGQTSWEPWPTSFIHFTGTETTETDPTGTVAAAGADSTGTETPTAIPRAGMRIGGVGVVTLGLS